MRAPRSGVWANRQNGIRKYTRLWQYPNPSIVQSAATTLLYDLDKASPHYHQQLSDFLCGKEYGNPSSELQSPDLASLAEYLDSVRH